MFEEKDFLLSGIKLVADTESKVYAKALVRKCIKFFDGNSVVPGLRLFFNLKVDKNGRLMFNVKLKDYSKKYFKKTFVGAIGVDTAIFLLCSLKTLYLSDKIYICRTKKGLFVNSVYIEQFLESYKDFYANPNKLRLKLNKSREKKRKGEKSC